MKCPPAYGFLDVLEKLWWRLDRALDADSNYYSALAFYVDAIKAGTTTIVDHHASPNAIAGSLDRIADAAKKSGVRSCLCYEVTDRNGIEGADEGIKENVRFINRLIDSPDPLLGILSTYNHDTNTILFSFCCPYSFLSYVFSVPFSRFNSFPLNVFFF